MIVDVTDRIPTTPNKVELTPVSGEPNKYILSRADEPSVTGTRINRELLMGMQGFTACETVFNPDGSITETGDTGEKVTTFNADGSITEAFTNLDGVSITKTTVFNQDGSITETLS